MDERQYLRNKAETWVRFAKDAEHEAKKHREQAERVLAYLNTDLEIAACPLPSINEDAERSNRSAVRLDALIVAQYERENPE